MEFPNIIWFNGDFEYAREACIQPSDQGLLTGHGIFETLIAHRGRPFTADRHYRRLKKSAQRLELEIPSEEALAHIMRSTILVNDLETADQCRLRVTITSGPEGGKATWMVSALPLAGFPAVASLAVLPYTRNENAALAGIKSTSFGDNVLALREIKDRGFSEGIFANTKGNICEGTSTNVFIIQKDGKLITPPLCDGCLPGITREIVIELCKKEEILLAEQSMPLKEFEQVRGAFLTSSLRGIQPVARIENTQLKLDPKGLFTQLQRAYRELSES